MIKITATAWAVTMAMGLAPGAMSQALFPAPSSQFEPSPGPQLPGAMGMRDVDRALPPAGDVANEAQVRAILKARGYTHVQAIERSADGWTATAVKNLTLVPVAIDDHGKISRPAG
jgi:hypothetical protein